MTKKRKAAGKARAAQLARFSKGRNGSTFSFLKVRADHPTPPKIKSSSYDVVWIEETAHDLHGEALIREAVAADFRRANQGPFARMGKSGMPDVMAIQAALAAPEKKS